MNLSNYIDIYAGGVGSGCQGPNCSRPSLGGINKWVIPSEKKNVIAVWKTLIKGDEVNVTSKFAHLSESKIASIKSRITKAGKQYGWKLEEKPSSSGTTWQVKYYSEGHKQNQLNPQEAVNPAIANKTPEPVKQETKVVEKQPIQQEPINTNIPIERSKLQSIVEDEINKVGDIDKFKFPSKGSSENANEKWNNVLSIYKKIGLTETDLKVHSMKISSWAGASNDNFAKLAQEAVYSKKYSTPEAKAMAVEYFITQKVLSKEVGQEVELHRGVGGKYAQLANLQSEERTVVTLNTRGADSWTNKPDIASDFGSIVLSNKFPIHQIVTSYKSNEQLHYSHKSEHEFVVVTPGKELVLHDSHIRKAGKIYGAKQKLIEIDVHDKDNFNWLHSMRKKNIKAGGPGSGCTKGSGCGPDKKFPGPEGQKAPEKATNAPAPFFKKSMEKDELEKARLATKNMRQWRSDIPSYKDWQTPTKIQEGTIVKTKETTRAFDNNKLEFRNYKAGTKLTVMNVLPLVGSSPQMITVQYPHNDIVHMKAEDVYHYKDPELAKAQLFKNIQEDIGTAPKIRPGKIEQQLKTPEGATYTKLKPENAGRPQGSGNVGRPPLEWKQGQPAPNSHALKGQFELAKGPKGNQLKDIFTFDLGQQSKQMGQGTARATVYDANYKIKTPEQAKLGTAGTTVIAWRDTTNKTGRIMELNKDQFGYIKLGSQPVVSFRNIGHMATYLNQRFGISMKLPGQSVAKRKKK